MCLIINNHGFDLKHSYSIRSRDICKARENIIKAQEIAQAATKAYKIIGGNFSDGLYTPFRLLPIEKGVMVSSRLKDKKDLLFWERLEGCVCEGIHVYFDKDEAEERLNMDGIFGLHHFIVEVKVSPKNLIAAGVCEWGKKSAAYMEIEYPKDMVQQAKKFY